MTSPHIHIGTSEDLSFLEDGSVDFIFTSPPYWNLKRYGSSTEIGQEAYDEYLCRLDAVFEECHRVARRATTMVVNIANRRSDKQYYPIAEHLATRPGPWTYWDHMVWYVPNAFPQANYYRERLFDSKHERLLVFKHELSDTDYTFHKLRIPQKYASRDPRTKKMNPDGKCIGNVVRIPAYRPPTIRSQGYHVAAFPESLAALMIETYTNPGDVVLDPFADSGTTLKVAHATGRKAIGVELNADFEPLIRQRIAEPYTPPDWSNIDPINKGGDA